MTRYRFGDYELDDAEATLTGPEGVVEMEPQVFDLLAYLVARPGSLVTKHDLLDNVWGDRFVAESSLTSRISMARKVVGDSGRTQSVIQTVHGRGYRFLPEVAVSGAGAPDTQPSAPQTMPPARAVPAVPAALEAELRSPFVGRTSELAATSSALGRGRHPGVGLVWIVGEPGIGKTRLAAEEARRAAAGGCDVLFGRCSEDLSVPYQPCIDALRGWVARRAPEVVAAELAPLGEVAGSLTRLVPELTGLVPPTEADGAVILDVDSERYRLFHAVALWLQVASAQAPVLWVIDDLHWAGTATLQLLAHLLGTPVEMDVTVVATARDTAPDDSEDLRALRDRTRSGPYGTVVRLGGLDEPAVAALVGTERRAADVLDATAGNPLLIRAMLGDDPGSEREGGGVDLAGAVRRRLSHIGGDAESVLTMAAVQGLEFDVGVVAAALDRDDDEVVGLLDEAGAARLVAEVDADVYRFAHALVRDVLRTGLSRSRRSRAHLALADAMESAPGVGRADPAAVLRHLLDSGRRDLPPGRLAGLAHEAAEAASRLFDHEAAVRTLDEVLERLGDDPGVPIAPLLLLRGRVQARAGLSVPATRSFDRAIEAARREGDDSTVIEAALGFEDASWRPGAHGGPALERLAAAEALVGTDAVVSRARLATARVRAHMYSGEPEAAEVAYAEAAELVASVGDDLLAANLIVARQIQEVAIPDPGVLADTEELEQLARRLGSVEHLQIALQLKYRELLRRGRMGEAQAAHEEKKALAASRHSRFWSYVVATHEACQALFEGRLDRAERLNAGLEELSGGMEGEDTSGIDAFRTFLLRREQDQLRRLAPLLRRVLAQRSAGPGTVWAPGEAVFLAEVDDLEAARDALGRIDLGAVGLIDSMWPAIMTFTAEVVHRVGAVERTAELLDHLRPQRGRFLVVGPGIANFGAADRVIGMLHHTAGDLDAAEEHLATAESDNLRAGSPLWAGYCALHRAQVAQRAGRPGDAAVHEARAAVLAAEHHLPALARRTAALAGPG